MVCEIIHSNKWKITKTVFFLGGLTSIPRFEILMLLNISLVALSSGLASFFATFFPLLFSSAWKVKKKKKIKRTSKVQNKFLNLCKSVFKMKAKHLTCI